jgi:uncharacterized membrane protein HdeD (DUF308 family)
VTEQYDVAGTRSGVSDLEKLRGVWLFLVIMGIALIVIGCLAIASSYVSFTTLAAVLMFGILLIVGAGFQFVTAIWGRCWKGFVLHVLAGVFYLIAGMFMIDNPVAAALALTMVIAIFLLVGGIVRIIMSLVNRFDGWGWVLLNGVISFILGILIYEQWPYSGTWVIGLFVGIEMIFSGITWLMLGMAAHSLPKGTTASS